MNIKFESYNNGNTIVPQNIINDLNSILYSTDIDVKNYAASKINTSISQKLKQFGWSDSIRIDDKSKISISATQLDIGLCLQTGNVSRTYADLLKLQTLFKKETIKAGVIIVPTATAAKQLGLNVASFERLSREILIFNQVITLPLLLVGFF